MIRPSWLDRFWSHVHVKDHGCWLWNGGLGKSRYGTFNCDGRIRKAHRVMYEQFNDPTDLYILHTCDNTRCVNPEHLFEGDQFDNMRDMASKGRNHVMYGRKNPSAKLTEALVRDIRERIRSGERASDVCVEYGVSDTLIRMIAKGSVWTWVA